MTRITTSSQQIIDKTSNINLDLDLEQINKNNQGHIVLRQDQQVNISILSRSDIIDLDSDEAQFFPISSKAINIVGSLEVILQPMLLSSKIKEEMPPLIIGLAIDEEKDSDELVGQKLAEIKKIIDAFCQEHNITKPIFLSHDPIAIYSDDRFKEIREHKSIKVSGRLNVRQKPFKITPLSEQKISDILTNAQELKAVSTIIADEVKDLLEGDFSYLKGLKSESELIDNFQNIIDFLHRISLLGRDFEQGYHYSGVNYAINSTAMKITNAYMRSKEKYKNAQVEVIEYEDKTQYPYYQDFTDKALLKALNRDLSEISLADEFNKSYVIFVEKETHNHVFTINVKKQKGLDAPLVEFFDSSPTLTRIGIKRAQSLVSNQSLPQYVIQQTVKKAFDEHPQLIFKNENYFHNSEPYQAVGYSYCGSFALEQSYEMAKSKIDERQKYLRDIYKYDSILGGKTEFDISYEESYQEAMLRPRGFASKIGSEDDRTIKSQITAFSHFNSATTTDSRSKHLATENHQKKSGDIETLEQRRQRYLQLDQARNKDINTLIHQKSMRHRLHLFEIISSDQFQEFALASKSELEQEELTKADKIFADNLKSRKEYYAKNAVQTNKHKFATNIKPSKKSKSEQYKVRFSELYFQPKQFSYDEENDQILLSLESGNVALESFIDIISANKKLSDNVVIKDLKRNRVLETLAQNVREEMRTQNILEIAINNIEEFFAISKENYHKRAEEYQEKLARDLESKKTEKLAEKPKSEILTQNHNKLDLTTSEKTKS